MKNSDNIGDLAAALAKAQGQMAAALKDAQSKGPTKHKYADLDAVWEACRGPLSDNGLSVAQGVTSELHTVNGDVWGWTVSVTTTLLHASGGTISETLTLPAVEQKGISMAQSIGVAATYARRYGLSAMVGITQEDNDGHVGQRRKAKETFAAKKARQGRHDGSWDKERPGFVMALHDRSWAYDDVKKQLLAEGRTAPSNWTQKHRQQFIAAIDAGEWPKGGSANE
jgi:hypothetical protein